MKKLITILFAVALGLNLSAQEVVIEYPYNPDFENDGNVGVEDLLELLSSFGMAFELGELTIDEVALSEWLQTISETLIAQQAIIDSLSLFQDSNLALLDTLALLQEQLDGLQASISSSEATLSSLGQYGFSCVDLGGAPSCPGEGYAPWVTLAPSDGYWYYVSPFQSTNADNLITTQPIWRKFQITGLPEGFSGMIRLRSISWNYGSSGNNPFWVNNDLVVQPQINGDEVFFWVYYQDLSSLNWDNWDCQHSIFDVLPEDHRVNGWLNNGTGDFEVWIQGEGGYYDSNIRFRLIY
jgi:hypothetical protein